jgi:dTDP-4-amino-4,6-dideoxygalactose transaminase
VAARVRIMRLHGIDREVWNRYTEPGAGWKYDVVAAGFKYNMTDIAAAIGREQLKKAETFLSRRRAIARRYISAFSALDFLTLPAWTEDHAWHLFIVRVREKKLAIGRDQCIEELQKKGIGVSVHFIALHTMKYYREKYGLKPDDFPAAMESSRACISLPLSAALTDDEVDRVIGAVTELGASRR